MQKAVGDFEGGVSTFQSLLDKLVAEVQQERVKLEQEKAQLYQDRQDFEDESKRVAQAGLLDSLPSTLGQSFLTGSGSKRHAGCSH